MSTEKPILVSFSGGLTSAFMAKFLQEQYSKTDTVLEFVFANTGKECEETLEFVNECDKRWGLNVTWIEGVVHFDERKSSTHKIVNFATAHRGFDLFKAMIKKYGLPNKSFPHCTRELKVRPMKSYMRSKYGSEFFTAIGIRADEENRTGGGDCKYPIYPLVQMGIDQRFIAKWWETQPFGLNLKSYQGNCDFCWKKSRRKRLTLIREGLDVDGWNRLEKDSKYVFDRDGYDISELIEMAKKTKFNGAIDEYLLAGNENLLFEPDYELDFEIGCFCQTT